MKVVATPTAVDVVRAAGGRLYVWRTPRTRGCNGMRFLRTAPEPPPGIEFTRLPCDQFELHFGDAAVLPARLEVEARRGRVEAYWDGCAWVI